MLARKEFDKKSDMDNYVRYLEQQRNPDGSPMYQVTLQRMDAKRGKYIILYYMTGGYDTPL